MILFLLACAKGLPTATVQVDGHPLEVEIAATPDHRARGLMDRDSMPEDHGMLFVYEDEKQRAFWMKSTRIPLSIAYADREGVIVRIADMQPFDTDRTPSLYPAMYALEVNQGWFEAHEVERGDRITGIPEIEVE